MTWIKPAVLSYTIENSRRRVRQNRYVSRYNRCDPHFRFHILEVTESRIGRIRARHAARESTTSSMQPRHRLRHRIIKVTSLSRTPLSLSLSRRIRRVSRGACVEQKCVHEPGRSTAAPRTPRKTKFILLTPPSVRLRDPCHVGGK